MSVLIHIEADWDERYERMQVKLEADGHQYIERLTRHEWAKLIYGLRRGDPLRVGGYAMHLSGPSGTAWECATQLRDYLFRVDEAFRKLGHTRLLKSNAPPRHPRALPPPPPAPWPG